VAILAADHERGREPYVGPPPPRKEGRSWSPQCRQPQGPCGRMCVTDEASSGSDLDDRSSATHRNRRRRHGAAALLLRLAVAEPAPVHGVVRREFHSLNVRPWAVVFIFVLSSVVLLPLFEVEGNRQEGTYYGDRIFGAVATGLRTSSWVPVFTRFRLCDRLRPPPLRPKCLPTIRSSRARGGASPIELRSCDRAFVSASVGDVLSSS
jgi:hypothetical protein